VTRATVNRVDTDRIDDHAPPRGTAIVRPLRHVQAVREHDAAQSADPSEAAAKSRSARAWAWALGESATAPVTDRMAAMPPGRSDIEAEITAAEERRCRGDQENRADAAAIILRWLIGDDDHVPVEAENPGKLVGGFGDVIRTPEQITDALALAAEGQQRAAAQGRDLATSADSRAFARQDAGYLDGVLATLAWTLGERAESPISRARSRELTTRALKMERVHAEDVIEQSRYPWMADRLPPLWYGEGVKFTISWLLGDWTAAPVDSAGRGPYGQDSELPALLRDAETRQRRL
jgi:hypothetical protein